MDSQTYRPNLSDFEVSRARRFWSSFGIALGLMALVGGALAAFVLPQIQMPKLVIHVVACPVAEVEEDTVAIPGCPIRLRPTPVAPASRPPMPTMAMTMPSAPMIDVAESLETPELVAQTENALETWNRFQEEEEQRMQELAEEAERQRKEAEEAALLAQQKEAAEKAERERAEAARQVAAREAAARRAAANARAAEQAAARRAVAEAEAKRRATAAQGKRVASAPSLTKRSAPKYPSSARRSGAQGTTKISATITADGSVSGPSVIASSGNSALDSAALSAVKKWRFTPAKNGLGQPIAYRMTIPVTFQLN